MIRLRDVLSSLTRTDDERQAFADLLRANQTPSERMMARVLFYLGIEAEPQVPLHGFIVDFLDRQNRTVIEVDGPIHNGRTAADEIRTKALERNGYRVIRVWNEQVTQLMQDIAAERSGA